MKLGQLLKYTAGEIAIHRHVLQASYLAVVQLTPLAKIAYSLKKCVALVNSPCPLSAAISPLGFSHQECDDWSSEVGERYRFLRHSFIGFQL